MCPSTWGCGFNLQWHEGMPNHKGACTMLSAQAKELLEKSVRSLAWSCVPIPAWIWCVPIPASIRFFLWLMNCLKPSPCCSITCGNGTFSSCHHGHDHRCRDCWRHQNPTPVSLFSDHQSSASLISKTKNDHNLIMTIIINHHHNHDHSRHHNLIIITSKNDQNHHHHHHHRHWVAVVAFAVDTSGLTPLMLAAFNGSVEALELLFDRGADPNAPPISREGT